MRWGGSEEGGGGQAVRHNRLVGNKLWHAARVHAMTHATRPRVMGCST